MKNIRIVVKNPEEANSSVLVEADSKRYGRGAIMFEGICFEECLDYIRRATRRDHFKLESYSVVPLYTDYKGKRLPWIMNVVAD